MASKKQPIKSKTICAKTTPKLKKAVVAKAKAKKKTVSKFVREKVSKSI